MLRVARRTKLFRICVLCSILPQSTLLYLLRSFERVCLRIPRRMASVDYTEGSHQHLQHIVIQANQTCVTVQ